MRPTRHDPNPAWRTSMPACAWALLLASLVLGCSADMQDAPISELYRQGNAFYEREQYAEASRTYERIVQQGFRNGFVYYNLGNAYFKQNQIGRAILAYERAARLMPRDQDVQANLEIANLRTVDRLEIPDPWIGQALLQSMTINEVTVVVSVTGVLLIIIGIGFVLADRGTTRRWLYQVGIVTGVVFLLCSAVAALRFYDYIGRSEAVILAQTCDARSGPGSNYDRLFSLHEGTKVSVVEVRGGWKRIALPDGKGGWVDRETLEDI